MREREREKEREKKRARERERESSKWHACQDMVIGNACNKFTDHAIYYSAKYMSTQKEREGVRGLVKNLLMDLEWPYNLQHPKSNNTSRIQPLYTTHTCKFGCN